MRWRLLKPQIAYTRLFYIGVDDPFRQMRRCNRLIISLEIRSTSGTTQCVWTNRLETDDYHMQRNYSSGANIMEIKSTERYTFYREI